MSKLIVTCASMYSGGAERVLSILSDAFAEHYDIVEYVTWYKYPIQFTLNPKVKYFCIEEETGSKNRRNWMRWFRYHVKELKPDIVLSLLVPINMMAMTALLGMRTKVIVCERSDSRYLKGGLPMRMLRNMLYRRAVGVVSQTESNTKTLPQYLQKKAKVIFNPINMGNEYIGKALKTEKDDKIVAVGRLIKVKNHEMLIRAFKRFSKVYPNYKLEIYGYGENEEHLRSYIEALGLTGKVSLPGSVPNVWDRIVRAKLYVHSSFYEGMPNALLEAMCLGMPCISTKVNGALDLIKSGENGILIEVGDEDGLFDSMRKMVDDPGNAMKMAQNATKIREMLDYDKIAHQWLKYIDENIVR